MPPRYRRLAVPLGIVGAIEVEDNLWVLEVEQQDPIMVGTIPGLRIVVDHLPSMFARLDANGRAAVEGTLRELAKRPQAYVKLSEVLLMVDGKASTDPALYKPTLDYLFDMFGEDRVIFGSDWLNQFAADHLPAIVKIVQDYFRTKSRAAAEKYFWRNSVAAYKWVKRDSGQPQP